MILVPGIPPPCNMGNAPASANGPASQTSARLCAAKRGNKGSTILFAARPLRRNRPRLIDGFDQQQRAGAKSPASQAARESAVNSQVSGTSGAARTIFVGIQTGIRPAHKALVQFIPAAGQGKHRRPRRERGAKLFHRHQRHAVRRGIVKSHGGLRCPDAIGKRAAPGTRMSGPPQAVSTSSHAAHCCV